MVTTNNGIIRKRKVSFTQVSNKALRDENLSLKAKGLYGLINSYITFEERPLYKEFIKSKCLEGTKAFESGWKELKQKGYLIQHRLKDKDGLFYYEYELLDEAEPLQNKESYPVPQNGGMDGSTPPVLEGMDNGPHGKGGQSINTKKSNTKKSNTNKDLNTTTPPPPKKKTAKAVVVVTKQSELILEKTKIPELSPSQYQIVAKWDDFEKLERAIQIFNDKDGLTFAFIEKIYKNGAIISSTGKKKKENKFNNMETRDYSKTDYDNLEQLEDRYIDRQLEGFQSKRPNADLGGNSLLDEF